MLEERELGRKSMYAVACNCNTTAMGPCCTVMRSQYHGLCVSVLGVCVNGGVYLGICLV